MIEQGSHVRLHYVLKVDGRAIDTSRDAEPIEYTHGESQILPGLEEQLQGLEEGQHKVVAVEPEGAYGQPDPEAVRSFPRSAFRDLQEVRAGQMIRGKVGGDEFRATIVSVDADQVLLDMNHPLAGKTLEYEVEIVKVD